MNISFGERLNFLLADRKQTPWGKGLGFTSASISRLFTGDKIPGPEFLYAIKRSENANLNWLLTGEGSPYIVNHYQKSEELSQTVKVMLEDESWVTYICELTERATLIFTQPGQFEFKGKFIDYHMVEILTGPNSTQLISTLQNSLPNIRIPDRIVESIDGLLSGNLGTYQLLHCENAVLKSSREATNQDLIPNTPSDKAIQAELMRAVVRLVEECELRVNEKLTPSQKSRVITAVYQNAARLSLSASDLNGDTIRTAIDTVTD